MSLPEVDFESLKNEDAVLSEALFWGNLVRADELEFLLQQLEFVVDQDSSQVGGLLAWYKRKAAKEKEPFYRDKYFRLQLLIQGLVDNHEICPQDSVSDLMSFLKDSISILNPLPKQGPRLRIEGS